MNAESERKLTEADFAKKKADQEARKKADIIAHAKEE